MGSFWNSLSNSSDSASNHISNSSKYSSNSVSNSSNSISDSSQFSSSSLNKSFSSSNSLNSQSNFLRSSIKGNSGANSDSVISSLGDFELTFIEIDSQEIRKKYSQYKDLSWIDYIKEKINKSEDSKKYALEFANQHNISVDELAYILGDEELYKKYFLRPRYNSLKIIESIERELKELKEDENQLSDEEIKEQITNITKRKANFFCADIKFILTDISVNRFLRVGNMATKIYNFFDKKFPYGALHAGLMVDETIIQWGRGKLGPEIVFPSTDLRNILFSIEAESSIKKEKKKKLFYLLSSLALGTVVGIPCLMIGGPFLTAVGGLAAVGGISSGIYYAFKLSWEIKEINEEELNKITKKCVLYNKRKIYDVRNNNCQKFVTDILDDIHAPFNPKGELKNLIDKISQNGYCEFIYKGNTFKSRREFDNYIKTINFNDLSDDDKKLLLCYKTLYDDRLAIIMKEEKQRSLTEEEKLEKEKYITESEDYWMKLLSNEN